MTDDGLGQLTEIDQRDRGIPPDYLQPIVCKTVKNHQRALVLKCLSVMTAKPGVVTDILRFGDSNNWYLFVRTPLY